MSDPQIVRVTEADGVDRYLVEEILRDSAIQLDAVPARFAHATVTVPQVAEWVRELVALALAAHQSAGIGDPEIRCGPSLLLAGPVGTGKTHQAWGAIRALAVSGVRCDWRVETVSRLLMGLEPRPDFARETALQAIESAGLLVLDDLGSTKVSAASEQIILRIVDHRYNHELPTLITTNLGDREGDLRAALGQRTESRLAQMCTAVAMVGADRRRPTR